MTHRTHGTCTHYDARVSRVFIVTLETGRPLDGNHAVSIDLVDPDSGLVLYSTPATRHREGKHAYRRAIRWADYHGLPVVFSHLGDGEPLANVTRFATVA